MFYAIASIAARLPAQHTATISYFQKETSSSNQNAGKPKTISKKADSGNEITSHFCGDCGTTIYRTGDSFPGKVVLKAGVLDDANWPNEHVPKGELFVSERVKWMPAISDADQMKGMPS
ncbi:hypothetical protein ACMFMG_006730 [Clarireedia jacksonii]